MKRFNFHLEPVLQHRVGLEQGALQARVRAEEKLTLNREALAQTQNLLSQSMETVPGELINPADGLNDFLYREHLASCAVKQAESVAGAESNLERCHHKLLEARKDKLVLEKLKEKQYQQYQFQVNSAEQKTNDELAMAVFNHHQSKRP